jgi:hypothetical protein
MRLVPIQKNDFRKVSFTLALISSCIFLHFLPPHCTLFTYAIQSARRERALELDGGYNLLSLFPFKLIITSYDFKDIRKGLTPINGLSRIGEAKRNYIVPQHIQHFSIGF